MGTYIGSTKKPLSVRLAEHIIIHYNHKFLNNKYVISSFDVIDSGNFSIELVEECTLENRFQRENFWIKSTDCVNKTFCSESKKGWSEYIKEYYYKNRQKEIHRKKLYYQKNKEYIKQKRELVKGFQNLPFNV